jgi:hypothetical protein
LVEIEQTRKLVNEVVVGGTSNLLVVAGIPAFNEAKTIAQVVLAAQKYANIVVVCDDGSSDLTGEIAERLGALVIRHEKNLGYGGALQSLFCQAKELKADVLVTFDSDGQHDPAQIPMLVKPIENGVAEVVLGSRFLDKNGTADMPLYRQFGVKLLTKLANSSVKTVVSDSQSGFRAYSKKALESISLSANGMSASVELLRSIGKCDLKVCEVPISCKYGSSIGEETSSEHPVSHGIGLVMSIVKMIVEDRPLPFLGIPGLISICVGALFGVWLLNIFAQTGAIVTSVALAAITFVLLGFFLTSTAITLYAITRLSERVKK